MRLALGTAQFGFPYGIANRIGKVSLLEARSILKLALSGGINLLDTAIDYGESEQRLGLIGVNSFKIVTKLPPFPSGCNVQEWVFKKIRESFLKLNINCAYGVLLHSPRQLEGPNGAELYHSMQSLKEKGLTTKIGISIYSPSELTSLCKKFYFDLVQAPFNLVDRRLLDTGWIRKLKDHGTEIHTRSVFLQGLLLMNQEDIPSKFKRWKSTFEKWHIYLRSNNISALNAALAYPLSFPEIDKIIVGVESKQQLNQILIASNTLKNIDLPDLSSKDEHFIIPANWSQL